MKRMLAMCGLALAIVAGARTPVTANEAPINYRNGYIKITNAADMPLYIYGIRHALVPGGALGITIDGNTVVPPGGVFYANRCCYAAGSEYEIAASYYEDRAEAERVHALATKRVFLEFCRHGDIPLGSADVKFYGERRAGVREIGFGSYHQATPNRTC